MQVQTVIPNNQHCWAGAWDQAILDDWSQKCLNAEAWNLGTVPQFVVQARCIHNGFSVFNRPNHWSRVKNFRCLEQESEPEILVPPQSLLTALEPQVRDATLRTRTTEIQINQQPGNQTFTRSYTKRIPEAVHCSMRYKMDRDLIGTMQNSIRYW